MKIDRKSLITIDRIPPKTEKAVIITYLGVSIAVSYEEWLNGKYRMEFIKQYGIPLPNDPSPKKIKETFSPNLRIKS